MARFMADMFSSARSLSLSSSMMLAYAPPEVILRADGTLHDKEMLHNYCRALLNNVKCLPDKSNAESLRGPGGGSMVCWAIGCVNSVFNPHHIFSYAFLSIYPRLIRQD